MHDRIDLVRKAWEKKILTPRFSACYQAMVEPIIQAVVDQDAHCVVSSAPIEWELFEAKTPGQVMEEFQKWDKPDHVQLHIEHICTRDTITQEPLEYESVVQEIINLGFPSLMIDASYEPNFEDNIAITRKVTEQAHKHGMLVEAEVGKILGYEEKIPYETIFKERMGFTTPEQAKNMVDETGCDWLAIAVGTIHGVLKGAASMTEKVQARLDVDLIGKIHEVVDVPLFVHGGTNVKQDDIKAAVANGLAKVCIGQDIRSRYQKTLEETNSIIAAKQAVYDRVSWLIKDYYGISGSRKMLQS